MLSEFSCTVVDNLTGLKAHCLEKQSSKKKAKSVACKNMLAKLHSADRVEVALFNRFVQKRMRSAGALIDMASVNHASKLLVGRRNYTKPPPSAPAEPEYDGPDLYCLNCGYGGDYRSRTLLRCGGCKKVWFCDKLCLRQKWDDHKVNCKYVPKPRRVLTKVVERFRSQPAPATSQTCTWNSGEALQLLARKWQRVTTRWSVDVPGPDRCAQCNNFAFGRDDPSDGCFYCLACWVDFNAQYEQEEVSNQRQLTFASTHARE